jgi:glycosyltransferase involved in cell wall biosynthesis
VRVLIHSNAPWIPTGYGVQARHLGAALRSLGHDVTYSAFAGLHGASIEWNGFPVLPSGQRGFGVDMLLGHAQASQAEVIIPLMDFYQLYPIAEDLQQYKVLPWLPVDCTPLANADRVTLQLSGAKPVAMSMFGRDQLTAAGFEPLYAPHVVDTAVFYPRDKRKLREELGLHDFFLIGMVAANSDAVRKSFPETFEAFRRFSRDHDDARLLVHTMPASVNGHNLIAMAEDFGIGNKVIYSDQYAQLAGLMDEQTMAEWYSALDVLSLCSYGEGFGVPLIEAQACGVPVITTDASAMSELGHYGWRVAGSTYWNPFHRAGWTRPDAHRIEARYKAAYREKGTAAAEKRSLASRDFASRYDLAAGVNDWERIFATLGLAPVASNPPEALDVS